MQSRDFLTSSAHVIRVNWPLFVCARTWQRVVSAWVPDALKLLFRLFLCLWWHELCTCLSLGIAGFLQSHHWIGNAVILDRVVEWLSDNGIDDIVSLNGAHEEDSAQF